MRTCKPGYVSYSIGIICLSFISTAGCPAAPAAYPPALHRADAWHPVYSALQLMARTAAMVTHSAGGLLHHLLTLTLRSYPQGGHSLLRLPTVANPFPLGSMMPCVARTFLRLNQRAGDRPAFAHMQCMYIYISATGLFWFHPAVIILSGADVALVCSRGAHN